MMASASGPPGGPPGPPGFGSSADFLAGGPQIGSSAFAGPPRAPPPGSSGPVVPPPPPPQKGPLAEAKQPETAEQAERRREKRKLDEKAREEEKKRKEAHQKEVQKKIEKIPMVTDIEKVSRMLEMGDFVAPYKWECQFPPIPDDPKLIDIPMDIKSLVKFRYDSKTEKEAKYELLTEPDLGITIDLVDPQAYEAPPGATLAPEDAELLSSAAYSAAIGEKGKSATATAKTLRQEVTWLRKTPLLGNNLYDAVHKYQKNPIERQHVHHQQQTLAKYGEQTTSYEQVLANIEASFTDAESMSLSNIKHPGGKEYEHLTPTAVLPVLPDEVCWENEYVQASFDVDPSLAAAGETEATYSKERVARAIAKQFKADGDKRFLGYLLPPEGYAPEQGGEMEEGVPMEWVRDYDFHMRDYSAFFLSVNDEGALYNAFEKRFTMTRSSFLTRNKRPKSITLSRSEQEEKEEGTKANLLKGAGAAQANLLKGPAALTYTGGGGGGASSSAEAGPSGENGGEKEKEVAAADLFGEDDEEKEEEEAAADAAQAEEDPFGGAGSEDEEGGGGGDALVDDD